MPDFWRNSGLRLLQRDGAGCLQVTPDFLRAYLLRPEVRPIEDSGPGELQLHEALMDEPWRSVGEPELAAVEDADARDNYRVLLSFFGRLKEARSLEGCYSGLFAQGNVSVPPLFVDQLAHIIVHNVMQSCEDPMQLRAAELFFREQRATLESGTAMLADLETVQLHASGGQYGNLGRLIVEAQTQLSPVSLDVLDTQNAARYWGRDQRHDFVVAISFGRPANIALCRVMEKWIAHFFGIEPRIQPLRTIDDPSWAWHIGLDAEASVLLDDLWRGEALEPGHLRRILALFRMDFADPSPLRPEVAGRPVYLALAMNEEGVVRLKPQNLLRNLPLAVGV
jgi:hypothetical protein